MMSPDGVFGSRFHTRFAPSSVPSMPMDHATGSPSMVANFIGCPEKGSDGQSRVLAQHGHAGRRFLVSKLPVFDRDQTQRAVQAGQISRVCRHRLTERFWRREEIRQLDLLIAPRPGQ